MNYVRAIKSRHGFLALMPVVPMIMATLVCIVVIPLLIYSRVVYGREIEIYVLFVSPVLAVAGINMILKILTTKVTVIIDYLEFNHIWVKHKIKWEQVAKIFVATNYFSRYNTHIYVKRKTNRHSYALHWKL